MSSYIRKHRIHCPFQPHYGIDQSHIVNQNMKSIFGAELGAVVFGVQRFSKGESLRRFIGSC